MDIDETRKWAINFDLEIAALKDFFLKQTQRELTK